MTAPAYYCKKFNKSISDPRANFSLVDKENYFFWPAQTLGRDAGGGEASLWWCWGYGGEEFQQKPSGSGLTYQMFTDVPEVCKWASWEIKQVGVCQARKSVMAKRSVGGGAISRLHLADSSPPPPASILCTPPPSQASSPGPRGPSLRQVAGSARLLTSLWATQRRPGSIIKSAPFPACPCIWNQRKKNPVLMGEGEPRCHPFLTAAHCLRLICAPHKLLTFLCPVTHLLVMRFNEVIFIKCIAHAWHMVRAIEDFLKEVRDW